MSNEKNSNISRALADDAPSAPPMLHEERQTMGNPEPPTSRSHEPSQGANFNQVCRGPVQDSTPFDLPPPSYQMAMNYPTTPYPCGGIPPIPAPSTGYAGYPPNPAFPVRPSQTPIYNATATIGTNHQLPPSHGVSPPTQVVVTVANGLTCPHCNVGVITKETDMCCMLCLILLTIFTFPLGLVFLCCLPCTITRRCSNCRRTA
ncbi:hypothetical protein KIN20_014323 [Parelaphostrongylus tenuis]|uniref:Membrane protein BRI3 n=1 Tax=Parelaphostrongylus tenuis TaxID=148309 RepID=A0AAD5QRR8_PARTN|nr:hypothetical protein KIN20_014323 [Parelaphostrongylus tenuis]